MLVQSGQILDLHVDGENQPTVSSVWMLILVQEVDHFVCHQFVDLLEHHTEVRNAVGAGIC